MTSSSLIVSIIIPLVFTIGTIAVYFSKRRIKNGDKIIFILFCIIQAASFLFSIIYLCLCRERFGDFLKKLFLLYFPTFTMILGFVLSAYQTLLSLILMSIEAAILHTEFESTKRDFIISISFFFIFLNILLYGFQFRVNNRILKVEDEAVHLFNFNILIFIVLFVCGLIMLIEIVGKLGFYFFFFICHYSVSNINLRSSSFQ